jgi:hypothetical protein
VAVGKHRYFELTPEYENVLVLLYIKREDIPFHSGVTGSL